MKHQEKQLQLRISWIDTAKGIGLLCVILGHLHIPFLASWIYTFHIPLFFFLSGCVFKGNAYSFKDYLIKKIRSLVIPYFCLGLVIFAFQALLILVQENRFSAILEMLWNFIKQEHFWTIWFLACLFLVEILCWVIHKLCSKKLWILIVSAGICLLGFLRYRLGWGALPWNLDVALIAQFFFNLGFLFYHSKIQPFLLERKASKICGLIVAGILINFIAGFSNIRLTGQSLDMSIGMYGNELLSIFSALAGILFIVVLSNFFSIRPLRYLGQNTMVIFAWHSRILIVLFELIFNALGLFTSQNALILCIRAAIIFVGILLLLIPATELIKRTKVRKWFGV